MRSGRLPGGSVVGLALALARPAAGGPRLVAEAGAPGPWPAGLPVIAYDWAGLRAPPPETPPCVDLTMGADGAWPLPIAELARVPVQGRPDVVLAVSTADPTCLYRLRDRRLEAHPLQIDTVHLDAFPWPPSHAAALGGALARDGRVSLAQGGVGGLVVIPNPTAGLVGPGAAWARVTILGDGLPTSEASFGGAGHSAAPLDRPGSLFAVSVLVDAEGAPLGPAQAWPLWAAAFGRADETALYMPGLREAVGDRPSAALLQLGFDGPDGAVPLSALSAADLGRQSTLRPVLPLGFLAVSTVYTEDLAAPAGTCPLGRSDPRVLLSPGRPDALPWTFADLAGWAPAQAWAPGSPTVSPALLLTDAAVDVLSRVPQADALTPRCTAAGLVLRAAGIGTEDHRLLVEAWEKEIPENRPSPELRRGAGNPRAGVLEWTERSLGRVLSVDAAALATRFPVGRLPGSPFVPATGPGSVSRWRFVVGGAGHAATQHGDRVYVGLGDPLLLDGVWRAGLLELPAALLDPPADVAEWRARLDAEARLVAFDHHWRLYEDLPVRRSSVAPLESLPLWTEDFFRLLARFAPAAGVGAPDPTRAAERGALLGALEWSPAEREALPGAYGARVRAWLRTTRDRRDLLLRARYQALFAEQRIRDGESAPAWRGSSRQVEVQPLWGALGGGAPPLDAGRPWPLVAPAGGEAALPPGLTLTITPGADGVLRLDVQGDLPPTLAVDHRARRHSSGWTLFSAWRLVSAADARADARLRGAAGQLIQLTWGLDPATGAPVPLAATQHDLHPGFAALARFETEAFRRAHALAVPSLWESRWLYRHPAMAGAGRTTLSPEAAQALAVQGGLAEVDAWPTGATQPEWALAAEVLDEDGVLLVALGGAPRDLGAFGVPVPFSFVEIPLPVAAPAGRPIPPPLVHRGRFPWLSTPAMTPGLATWLVRSRGGTAGCPGVAADRQACRFRLADLAHDPDTGVIVLAAAEPRGEDAWLYYHASLDRPWFSLLGRVDGDPEELALERPAVRLVPGEGGAAWVGLRGAGALDGPWAWVPAATLTRPTERPRSAPCLDPSDPRCRIP